MLRIRIATALVLIAVVGGILCYAPAWAFGLLVILAVVVALDEFYRLIFPRDRLYRLLGCGVGVVIAAAHQWPRLGLPVVPLLVAGCFCIAVVQMLRATTLERFVARSGATWFGIGYLALTLPYLTWLRELSHGRTLVVLTLAMVALSDTFAYAVGRTIGRIRLAPLVSPNKTVEGFIAGFGGSVAAALLCRALLWRELPLVPLIGLALVIGLIAPLGDLIESAIKRAYHVKDSGRLLPGHGGMLDRADAYIFSAPAVYYYVEWLMR